jgi:hypothetical protein
MKVSLLWLILILSFVSCFGQEEDDLMKLLGDEKPRKEKVYNAFKSSRVIMSQSMEMLRPGVLDFRILHRFGRLNGGAYELFGLDGPATVRLGLDYGVSDFLTLGIGRSTTKKELDATAKLRIIHQSTGKGAMPFSLVIVGGGAMNGLKNMDTSVKHYFTSRLAYYGQLIIGRKFSDNFTLQFMPAVVHMNLVPATKDDNDLLAAGVGARMKLTKRISLNADFYYVANPFTSSIRYHPFSLGFDFETGGHVFQLHFTNAKGMNERAFIADTDYNWGKGDIMFGFNISRSFQLKKKKL